MKIFCAALLMLLSARVIADNQKTISNSEIKDVKVFLSGVQVERTFKTNLDVGTTTIVVSDLSSLIDKNSITASVNSGVMILSTSYQLDYLQEERVSPKLKSLKDSLEILNDNTNELNVMKSVYNEEIAMLGANRSVGGSNVGVSAENLQKVSDFYRARMIELKTKLLDIDKKIGKIGERIRRINEQIAQENGKLNRPYGTIIITVSTKQPASANFELSYFANGASWRPSYDIRSENVKSEIKLLYKANVLQNTGEDWKNIHVTLSTGNPTLGGNKPQLQPWYLRLTDLNIRGSRYEVDGYKSEDTEDRLEMQMKEVQVVTGGVPAQYGDSNGGIESVTTSQQNQIVTEFEIQIPYTVMSDGKEVSMDIQSHSLPANYSYYVTPKMVKDAFLVASITGWEKYNLLPGKANIYLENSYVGESYVNPLETSDTLKLSFGRDKRIVVKREQVKEMNTSKFIGNNVEKEFMFETTIRNTKKDTVKITIEDQLPLSTDENIKITNGELSGGNLDEKKGMINWNLELKPGESKSIRLGYKVRYPGNKRIPGL